MSLLERSGSHFRGECQDRTGHSPYSASVGVRDAAANDQTDRNVHGVRIVVNFHDVKPHSKTVLDIQNSRLDSPSKEARKNNFAFCRSGSDASCTVFEIRGQTQQPDKTRV